MYLFDHILRHDSSPASHLEPLFQFLNRVDTPYWEEVRQLLERWYRNVPDTQQLDIRERFRAPDNRQTMSAFWELYLHEALTHLGFTVTPHPEVSGYRTKPDFLVSRPDGDFYLEAVMLSDLESERLAERRRAVIYDAINHIPSPDYYLWTESLRETSATPSLRKLKGELGAWLRTLDPDDARFSNLATNLEPWESLPYYDWHQDGWHMRFVAFPRGPRSRGKAHGPTVGAYGPGGAIMVDDHFAIKQRLEDKASKYGQLDRPFVIAILSLRITTRQSEILEALYGSAWEYPQMIREGIIRRGGWTEGLWLSREGSSRRNVSAVLTSSAVRPWMVARANFCIFHNPWATHAVRADLPFASVRADLEDGSLQASDATLSPSQIFGIDPNWPPGEPFPDHV
jgi:hypothetical protein